MAAKSKEAATPEEGAAEKPSTAWAIPLITAATLALLFCAYYFVYVGARREYLANRNFRSLALLGEQLQQRISIHGNILEFCASLSQQRQSGHHQKLDLDRFLIVRKEDESLPQRDKEREALKDYLKYLAPSFDLNEVPRTTDSGRRLRVERRNDTWELILSAFPPLGSDKHQKADKDFQGSLKIDDVMTPLVGSLPFDDILLVSQEGTIVYQSKKTGPQFMTLSALLQSQITETPAKSAVEKEPGGAGSAKAESKAKAETHGGPIDANADPSWRARSMHMTEVMLAAKKYN
jgi:hypothetical protein